jgi:hypothetical protein
MHILQPINAEGDTSWGAKSKALVATRDASSQVAQARDWLEGHERELRHAIKAARAAGVPDAGIAEAAEISPTKLRELVGPRKDDPGAADAD